MIKGLCIESGKGEAKLLFEGSIPLAGKYYYLEDITTGSKNQNNLFHALLQVFWNFMFETNTFIIEDNGVIYDLSSDCWESLKDLLKSKYGLKFSHIEYVNDKYQMKKVFIKQPKDWIPPKWYTLDYYEPWALIPDYAIEDFTNGNSERIKGVLISWADYSMPQRHKLITKVFLFMDLWGVESYKYEEIKNGLIELDNARKEENRRLKNDKKLRREEISTNN